MPHQESHLSDEQLLLELDGETSIPDASRIAKHLGECWKCRARRQEIERAIADYVQTQQDAPDAELPSAAGPRALLKARLAQYSAAESRERALTLPRRLAWTAVGASCCLLAISFAIFRSNTGLQNRTRARVMIISVPDARLTPGAAVFADRQAVCTQENAKNKTVPVALQRKVFDAYGIAAARPGEYEVDYLITPALGGADDIHNLWPQSYSATVWNAEVKDALEDRLRDMVCGGNLDLQEAQQEIAGNWIAAYKKYFNTDQPLADHWKRTQ